MPVFDIEPFSNAYAMPLSAVVVVPGNHTWRRYRDVFPPSAIYRAIVSDVMSGTGCPDIDAGLRE
jgi:hypothetical protein